MCCPLQRKCQVKDMVMLEEDSNMEEQAKSIIRGHMSDLPNIISNIVRIFLCSTFTGDACKCPHSKHVA